MVRESTGYRPRQSLCRHHADAHRGAGIWESLAGMDRNYVRGERGGFVPTKAAAEDPHHGWDPQSRGLRTGPQSPYATTPRGEPLGKFGSTGMMSADDGRAPSCRDATNLNPPPPPAQLPP